MPQRKKTEPIAAAAELPDLTAQQMRFVELVLAGKTATDAYRIAYTDEMAPESTWGAASRLRNDPKIRAWIDAAKLAGLCKVSVTYESVIRELEEMKTLCVQTGNMGAAVECVKSKARYSGLDVDRVQEVPMDPAQTLRDLARHLPEAAAALAAEHDIPWAEQDATLTRH